MTDLEAIGLKPEPTTDPLLPPSETLLHRVRRSSSWWILRRLLVGVGVVFVVCVIVFAATQALPSDPAQAILGREATPELVAALRTKLGLDRPAVVQFGDWLGGLVRGDLGTSLASGAPVGTILGPALVNSLALLVYASLIMVPASILLGTWMAVHEGRRSDRVLTHGLLALMAVPDFVVGAALLVLFAITVLPIFPAVALIPPGETGFTHPVEMVLPALTGALITVPFLARQTRAALSESLKSEYIAQARLRGIPEWRIIWRHALPNSLVPVVQGTATMLGYLLGGVVVIEYVFNYPGLGSALNSAVTYRDIPVIQAVTLVFALGVVLFNLTADVCTVLLSPKLRTSGGVG